MNNSKLYHQRALEAFLPHIPKSSKVIDINPNQGIYSREFLQRGFNTIGVHPVGQPPLQTPFVEEMIQQNIEDILMPYKSIGAVWAHQSLNGLTKEKVQRRLSLFYDWLCKDGVIYFGLLEGEGYKWITEQSISDTKKKLIVYYSAEEIEEMIYSLGYEAVDAWRDPKQDKVWINIIAKRINN